MPTSKPPSTEKAGASSFPSPITPRVSKERRMLQDLVNQRVQKVFTDDSHDDDLSELTTVGRLQTTQLPLTRLIPVQESPPAVPVPAASTAAPGVAAVGSVVELPVEQIVPSPYQPRTSLYEEADEALMESVKTSGVLQPILVRPLPSGQFELVAGERRWRACQKAGRPTVLAVVRPISDEEAAMQALIENLQRVDLGPLELARAYEKVISQFGLQYEDLAKQLSVSVSTIKHTMRVLALPAPILEQVLAPNSGLTLTHAEELLQIKDQPGKLERLTHQLLAERWSVDRLRAEIGRTPRINKGAQAVHFEDRGEKGFRVQIRFQTNRPQDFPEIQRVLEDALKRVQLCRQHEGER